MSAKRACLECRAKKVKCVPGAIRCMRCMNLGIEDCTYEWVKKRGVGRTLRTGEACEYCRVKKKKCDAKRPCTSCIRAKNAPGCVYSDKTPFPGQSSTHSHGASSYRSGEAEPAEFLGPTPSTSDTTRILTRKPSALQMLAGNASYGYPPGLDPIRRNSSETDISPPISIISSFLSPRIPPEPQIPLSFLGEENLQVSDSSTTDLDMRCRLWALLRYLKFGFQFSREKSDALLRGDESNAVVDSFFLYGSHALGMPYCIRVEDTPAMVRSLAIRTQLCWERLAEIVKGNNNKLKVQTTLIVATTYTYVRLIQSAALYIQKSCDFIEGGDMRFVPAHGHPPELSEDLHETLLALSQNIYWANYLFLMCGGPEPHATFGLENQFRQELPDAYPILFDICPLTMRTQGILFVRDVVLLLTILPADDTKLESWRRSCDRTLTSLESFSRGLLRKLRNFQKDRNVGGADVIGSSCIACLAHLAILSEAVYRVDPIVKSETYEPCDWALQSLGEITSELCFDEYSYLDLLTGDSWKKSLQTFDARIASLPFEESGDLRYCRKVVGEKYSDFQTRLPNCDPPIIISLSMSEDGTTESSKYPNLIPAEARIMYGI